MIPRHTFEKIIDMLESPHVMRMPNYCDYLDILYELKVKMQKLELRGAYVKIITAKDSDTRDDARIEYLWQKSQIGNVDVDEFDFKF